MAFETCRRVLREELGLEPMAETSALLQRIESGDLIPGPAVYFAERAQPTVPVINPLPQALGSRYIGRRQEQAAIAAALTGGSRLVSVYGRGGVGKTALACRAVTDLLQSPASTLLGGVVVLSARPTCAWNACWRIWDGCWEARRATCCGPWPRTARCRPRRK
jgi:hypothetical protein